MHNDEPRRYGHVGGGRGYQGRQQQPGQNYSPSANYNYNPGGTGQGHLVGGGHGGSNMQQPPRRRQDRFKRDIHDYSDKIVKQNDVIIKLLKEISSKLSPAQAVGAPIVQNPTQLDQPATTEQRADEVGDEGSQGVPEPMAGDQEEWDEESENIGNAPEPGNWRR
jgi:hypothetical protein